MRLLADEGVDRPIVERLRADSHELLYVAEFDPGISDETVLRIAHERGMSLITADKDFGELVFRQKHVSSGVILLRLSGLSPTAKASITSVALRDHSAAMQGAFSVVTPAAVRIRHEIQPASGE